MITYKPYPLPYGVHYLFSHAGEGIPMHAHANKATWHKTRCLNGKCEIYGDGMSAVLIPGDEIEFKSYRMHEIVALEDGTEIANIFTFGKPKDYEGVSDETLSGVVESRLLGKDYFKVE